MQPGISQSLKPMACGTLSAIQCFTPASDNTNIRRATRCSLEVRMRMSFYNLSVYIGQNMCDATKGWDEASWEFNCPHGMLF